MPFSYLNFIDIHSPFFILTVLSSVLLLQIMLGVLMPGQNHKPPFLWWFAQSLAASLQSKLNRPNRGRGALFIRGLIALGFLVVVAWSLSRMTEVLSLLVPYGWLVVPVLIWGSVNLTVTWRMLRGLFNAKSLKDIQKNSGVLSDLTGVKFKSNDPHTVARTSILYSAHSLVHHVIGPLLAFGFFGMFGGFLYMFVLAGLHTRYFSVTAQNNYFAPFVLVALVLDFVPTRIAMLYIYVSAIITPTAHPRQCLHLLFDGSQRYAGFNWGSAIKAYAGAVGVSLGGGLSYKNGDAITLPWVGHKKASAKAGIADIKRAFVLHVFAAVFILLTLLMQLA